MKMKNKFLSLILLVMAACMFSCTNLIEELKAFVVRTETFTASDLGLVSITGVNTSEKLIVKAWTEEKDGEVTLYIKSVGYGETIVTVKGTMEDPDHPGTLIETEIKIKVNVEVDGSILYTIIKEDGETIEVATKPGNIPVTSISIDSTLNLVEGNTKQLAVTILPENATDKSVTWKSSDETVVTVDADGKLTAKKAGTATITATSGNLKTAACYVTVTQTSTFGFDLLPGSDISVTRSENVLTADEGYTDYTWYVDNVKQSGAATNTFDLDAAGLTKSGIYNITLEAKKNGRVYSSSMNVGYIYLAD